MSRENFNRDMDDYLRQRRVVERTNPLLATKRFFTKTFGFGKAKQKQEEELPLDIPPEQVAAVLAQGTMQRTGGARKTAAPITTKPAPRAAQTKETTKMGWFNKKKEQEEDYDMAEGMVQQPVIDEEVKEVLKITFKWLKMMDADTVEEIKNSSDFEKYKKVLDKYGLIKK